MAKAGWHREQIKAELRIRYGSMSNLARKWGYHPNALQAVLTRANASIKLEKLIADAIGQAPYTLWPDRWSADGLPLHRSAEWSRSRNDQTEHSKISEAA